MENSQQDNVVLKHITQLTEREEHLYGMANITEADIAELHRIKLALDQYWDLLRQRRALRDAGKNPGKAHIRPADQIANYDE